MITMGEGEVNSCNKRYGSNRHQKTKNKSLYSPFLYWQADDLMAAQITGTIKQDQDCTEEEDLFVLLLSNLYHLKYDLFDFLPFMISKVSNQSLKLIVLETSSYIDSQILRFNMIFKLLNEKCKERNSCVAGNLDLKTYFYCLMDESSAFKSDYALLSKLFLVESTTVTTLLLIKQLAKRIKNKSIYSLIQESLKAAIERKSALGKVVSALI